MLYTIYSLLFSISKCTHPQWTEVLTTDYEYGTEVFFFVRVLRHHRNDPDHPTLMGSALFEVSDIMGTATRTKVRRLPQGGWYVDIAGSLEAYISVVDLRGNFLCCSHAPITVCLHRLSRCEKNKSKTLGSFDFKCGPWSSTIGDP